MRTVISEYRIPCANCETWLDYYVFDDGTSEYAKNYCPACGYGANGYNDVHIPTITYVGTLIFGFELEYPTFLVDKMVVAKTPTGFYEVVGDNVRYFRFGQHIKGLSCRRKITDEVTLEYLEAKLIRVTAAIERAAMIILTGVGD